MRMGKRGRFTLIVNMTIILLIVVLACKNIGKSDAINEYELPRDISEVYESDVDIENYECCGNVISVSEIKQQVSELEPDFIYEQNLTENDKYLLAKIAKCEAGNQNIQTKTLVIMVVLNRVESEDFPDSISEVIFQKVSETYQFSPVMQGGNWWNTEPDEDSYEALDVVLSTRYDYSDNALYFESCEDEENWHSRNLTYLYQSEDLRFYK